MVTWSSLQNVSNLKLLNVLQFHFGWPLTLVCDCWPHECMPRFHNPSLVAIELQTFQMRQILHFQTILPLDLEYPLTLVNSLSSTNEGFHVASTTQIWLKSIKPCGKYDQKLTFFMDDNKDKKSCEKTIRMCISYWGRRHKNV